MEIDKSSEKFNVLSTEPFGRLLLDIMQGKSHDESIYGTQKKIGQILLVSYLDKEIEDQENFKGDNARAQLHSDIAVDMSIKALLNSKNHDVLMSFEKEYFDGLEKIASRKSSILYDLYTELEIVSVAYENDIASQEGILVDEQDLDLIKEEIEQAEAAKKVLDMIRKYRRSL